jgi:Fur family transcriptional regulator, ferric uptake regulator
MNHLVISCDTVAAKSCTHSDISCDTVATGSHQPCPFQRNSLLDELTSRGVRLTAQRRAVVEIIQEADHHLDAASLLELAQQKQPAIDRATVYRTIDLLKKLRLIDELDLMHLKGEKHYYEVKTRREHVHLACFRCGRIEEVSSVLFEQLKEQIARQADFELQVTRLEMGGLCRTCRSKVQTMKEPHRGLSAAH